MATFTLTASGNADSNGVNLQGLFNQVSFGDTIVIPAGTICRFPGGSNPLVCPVPKGSPAFAAGDARNFVNVQSGNLPNLPQPITGQPLSGRIFSDQGNVAPTTASDPGPPTNMARICLTATTPYTHLMESTPNAQYWKFLGLEFCPNLINDPAWLFFLINLGTGTYDTNGSPSGTASAAARYFYFDRCYLHAWDKQPCVKNALFTNNLTVVNSWLDNFKTARGSAVYSGDSEALYMNGPGPYMILNNYIASTHEPVFFGWGSGMSIQAMPGDGGQSVVQYNTITKRTQWLWGFPNYSNPSTWPTGGNSDVTGYFLKNLIEVKTGYNILIDHNTFQYSNDSGDQRGVCFAINLIDYSNAGVETAHDIQFTNNRIDSVLVGWAFSHNEDPTNGIPNAKPGQIVKNITVKNNLIINHGAPAMSLNGADAFGMRLVMDAGTGGPGSNIVVDHNTFVTAGGGTPWGPIGDYSNNGSTSALTYVTENGFKYTNNIVSHGQYGYSWQANNSGGYQPVTHDNLANLQAIWPSATVSGNVVFGTGSVPVDPFTSDNTPAASQSAIGFNADWSLSAISSYKGKATDATDPGCNIAALSPGSSTGTATSTSVTSSLNPSTVGQSVTFTASVSGSGATGTVQFQSDFVNIGNPVTLNAGSAAFTISNLTQGTHTIMANYSGNSTFAGSSGTLTQTVNAGPTTGTTTAIAQIPAVNYPAVMPVKVTVASQPPATAIPTGNVSLSLDGKTMGLPPALVALDATGSCIFPVHGLQPGTHTFIATYQGAPGFAGSPSSPQTGIVNVGPTSVSFSVPGEPFTQGQNATVILTVTSP